MEIAAIRHVRSETCETSVFMGATLADGERASCLLGFDFVELVPTDISNFFVARKELIIDRHDQSFKGTNHSVVDTVMIQNLLCIYSTCIHSLDIVFTLNKVQPMRPNVSRIPH